MRCVADCNKCITDFDGTCRAAAVVAPLCEQGSDHALRPLPGIAYECAAIERVIRCALLISSGIRVKAACAFLQLRHEILKRYVVAYELSVINRLTVGKSDDLCAAFEGSVTVESHDRRDRSPVQHAYLPCPPHNILYPFGIISCRNIVLVFFDRG